MRHAHYAEVLVPLNIGQSLIYEVPASLQSGIKRGICVRIQVSQMPYIGIVWRYPVGLPRRLKASQVIRIDAILHSTLCLPQTYCDYLAWVSAYYMGDINHVMGLALESLHKADGKRFQSQLAALLASPTPPTSLPDPPPQSIETPALKVLDLDKQLQKQKRPILWSPYNKEAVFALLATRYIGRNKGPVLYLFPETEGLLARYEVFKKHFPSVGLYYGTQSTKARLEVWWSVLQGTCSLLLSAPLGIWLPFDQLGAVLIEEESSGIYRERYRAFHYHARDMAIQRAHMSAADCILMSQSPSIESHYNVSINKYGAYASPKAASLLPKKKDALQWIDLLEAKRKGRMHGHSFGLSRAAYDAINLAFSHDAQVVIVHADKAYGVYAYCGVCNEIARCAHCGSVLRLLRTGEMLCGRCRDASVTSFACANCKAKQWVAGKEGLEKIAEYLRVPFPQRRIGFVDKPQKRPTAKALSEMWNALATGELDVVLSTFRRLEAWVPKKNSLLLCWDAQSWLAHPDFRIYERFFQWAQAAYTHCLTHGVRFMIQAHSPADHLFGYLQQNNPIGFAKHELEDRRALHYPPYRKHIYMHLQHTKITHLDKAIQQARAYFDTHTLTEHHAVLPTRKESKSHIQTLCIEALPNANTLRHTKEKLLLCKKRLCRNDKNLLVRFEVDP